MTIIKRGDSYGVRAYVNGSAEWVGTFPTRRAAKEAEREALARGNRSLTDLTVCELSHLFHEQHTVHKATSTRKNYKRATNAFDADYGKRRADSITFVECQAFANDHARSLVDAVSTMYEWARKARIVAENPLDGVTRRSPAWQVTPQALTETEVRDLAAVAINELDPITGEQMAAMILFAAGTCMRPSEIFALRWRDIDFAGNRVNVRSAFGGDGIEKSPKNGKPRVVALLTLARDGLALMQRRGPDDFIWVSGTGSHLSKATLTYRWHQVRNSAGLKKMRFYDLRHTGATRLLELGAYSYEVAEQLGHQDNGRLVERRYGHPSTERSLARLTEIDSVASAAERERNSVANESQNTTKAAS